ncbi:MAG: SH3 domain-containing protein [Methylocystis sp.]
MLDWKLWAVGAATLASLALSAAANAGEIASPVNVRSGPGTNRPVVATIPAGTDVQVLTCASGWHWRWCKVQAGDVKGYVHQAALAQSGGHVDVAEVVTTDATALHKSPRIFSHVLATIPAGAQVNVLHCASGLGSGWCHVGYGGAVGYVRGGLIERNTYGLPFL